MPLEQVIDDSCVILLAFATELFFPPLVVFLQNMQVSFLLSVLILCKSEASGKFPRSGTGTSASFPPLHADEDEDEGNFAPQPQPPPPQTVAEPSDGWTFTLKVQVTDMLTRQYLARAEVDLHVNYTRIKTVLTGEDGGVLLRVPFQSGSPVTVRACKDGYVCALLSCQTVRRPIFSSVTVPLRRLTQGNVWIFEDSFLITDKASDASWRPVVQFPKSLLNLSEGSDVAALKAYLTVPEPPSAGGGFLRTLGVMSSTAGYINTELKPAAAVSVQLFRGDTELRIGGPVKISLTLPDNCGLRSSNALPAWFYNRTTGGWMRQGLGTVVSEGGKLRWTFSAPHLGYWMAAPVPTRGDVFGADILGDFFARHWSFVALALGGMLCFVACLLAALLYCQSSARKTKVTHAPPKKDRATATGSDEDIEGSSPSQRGLKHARREERRDVAVPVHDGDVCTAACTVAAQPEIPSSDATEPIRVPESLTDALLFYSQPVAILHASAFFQAEDQPQQPRWTAAMEASEESSSLNASQGSTQNQEGDPEGHAQNTLLPPSRGQRGLLESASVPETLSRLRSSRRSMEAAGELSKAPSWQPPRAWFVSLEGKPAAEIRYAVEEQQRRRTTAGSQETSLDSGVDMIEMNQTPGRRAVTLERKGTFVKRAAGEKQTAPL
ncbi:protein FAM171B isoform X2 [Syngnathus scovelli]|uniref:protein FAM171B isoform X2 n=1 Tax=Syngnathus scovelli TaxID=161590 RepID=UPI002110CE0B|nr:protein FAM171B isoform X2 [Syngnathus scovelli]